MIKEIFCFTLCLTLIFFMAYDISAEIPADALEKRIDHLEKELKELKRLLQQQNETAQETKARPQKEASGSVSRRFRFKSYGYIKMDAAHDDSETNYGNFVLYIPNEGSARNDSEFHMTARETRAGLYIEAPEFDGWSTRGRLEIDFFGDGTEHENKAAPLLRHAVLEMRKGNFGVLAGQTWDIISPLNPTTLNYSVAWAAGNIAYRRPQLRATFQMPLNENNRLNYALGIFRTAGLVNADLDSDDRNDGDDAGSPTVQARIVYATKDLTSGESIFGLSGHYGEEDIDFAAHSKKIESWSVNGDFKIPFFDQWCLSGEIFLGSNLDDYFGGILQGVNMVARDGIQSVGGWAQLKYRCNEQWQSNAGFGIDDPNNSDLNDEMRSRNMVFYVNGLYNILPPVTIGVEYSHWQTQYKAMGAGIDNRIQTSFIYNW